MWDSGRLDIGDLGLIQTRISRVLIQILNQVLLVQNNDGTWDTGKSPEVNAYAILTLVALGCLPQVKQLEYQIQSAINGGRQALMLHEGEWIEARHLWIEKVTYGSSALSESYCLAAMNAPFSSHAWSSKMDQLALINIERIPRMAHFIGSLNKYSNEPRWKILASVIEGFSYLEQLKKISSEIFPYRDPSKELYLYYIPCSWTIINNHSQLFLNADLLWDMMVISMLNFLVDDYMESVVADLGEHDLEILERLIPVLCSNPALKADRSAASLLQDMAADIAGDAYREDAIGPPAKRHRYDMATDVDADPKTGRCCEALAAITSVLDHYIRAVLDHPHIQEAFPYNRSMLQTSLQTFLHSHLQQIRDNKRLRYQKLNSHDNTQLFQTSGVTHYTWSRTTAANHTSCPYSFSFFTCHKNVRTAWSLNGSSSPDCFQTGYQKYMAEAVCLHLATMTRLYNDYGSLARDRLENNLNSLNFPEFHSASRDEAGIPALSADETKIKTELLSLAAYEKESMRVAAEALLKDLERNASGGRSLKLANALRLFIGVTEFYADVYVARDVGIRKK